MVIYLLLSIMVVLVYTIVCCLMFPILPPPWPTQLHPLKSTPSPAYNAPSHSKPQATLLPWCSMPHTQIPPIWVTYIYTSVVSVYLSCCSMLCAGADSSFCSQIMHLVATNLPESTWKTAAASTVCPVAVASMGCHRGCNIFLHPFFLTGTLFWYIHDNKTYLSMTNALSIFTAKQSKCRTRNVIVLYPIV